MRIAAYGFLIFAREKILPLSPRRTTLFQTPVIPDRYRPEGSPCGLTIHVRSINAIIKRCRDALVADRMLRDIAGELFDAVRLVDHHSLISAITDKRRSSPLWKYCVGTHVELAIICT